MKTRNETYNEIFENFWDAKRKAFVQHKGSDVKIRSRFAKEY